MSIHVQIASNTVTAYNPRTERMGGRGYIVAPVVILVEGIHHGSAGRIFYPLNELSTFPGSWDGRPVTLGHPEIDGEPVSASSPEVLELFCLGTLFNTRYDEELRGLRSEVWVDVDRARRIAPELLEAIRNGEAIEVSTGLWFESEGGPGVWQNEEFELTAASFRPDHLALLPGQVGACSISDGCGLRANKKEGGDMAKSSAWDRFVEFVKNEKPSKEEQVAIHMKDFAANQPGMLSSIRALQSQLDALDRDVPNGRLVFWLEEVFTDGTFIARQSGPEGTKFFKSTFTVMEDDSVEISESDFTEVRKKEEFIEVSNTTIEVPNKEDENVSDETKKLAVDNLIACGKTTFTENHRAGLMAMNECDLAVLKAPDEVAPAPAAPAEVVNAQPVAPTQPQTLEQSVTALPQEHQAAVNEAIKANEKLKEDAIVVILAAPGNKFTKEGLAAKNLADVLGIEAIAKGEVKDDIVDDTDVTDNAQQAAPKANFSGAAPVKTEPTVNADDAPLGRPMQ